MMQVSQRHAPVQRARVNVRDRRPSQRPDDKERWAYQQNGVKLLQISQDCGIVNVGLLRYTNSQAMFTTSTIWKLPFKLKNLKAYLMHPYLSEDERDALLNRLEGISTDQFKFEHLMAYRLNNILKTLPLQANVYSYTKHHNPDTDWYWRLFHDTSKNAFIQQVLERNCITAQKL